MKKIIEYLINPKKIIIYLMNKNFFFFLPDKIYLKWKFKLIMNEKLDLRNPKTFNQKLQWLKLNDKNPKYTKLVDKYEVRNFIKEQIGEEHLIPLIGIYNNFEEINFSELPDQFVIKCNHDSGRVFVCKDKEKLDIKKMKKMINKSLKRNYYKIHREWPYKNVKRKIIIEKYMSDDKQTNLIDYKVMCFDGKAKLSFTCTDRFADGLKVTFFDLNWNKLPFTRHYPNSKETIRKPLNYNLMIKYSEKLAANIPFVRVDWYEINEKLYFGELTFYPGSGYEEFEPKKWDEIIGDYLIVSKSKNKNEIINN